MRTPLANEHVLTLIELLKPAGPDLARRLVSALLLAPEAERDGIVEAIEARMVELFAPERGGTRQMDVLERETQRDGYVEQVFRTYEVADSGAETRMASSKKNTKRKSGGR